MADALAPRHRLVAYDLRGRGDSDKPASGYSLATHGDDLRGLLDHLGLERATLMGHSLGAHIAVRFAARHPERVARLVLFDGGLDVRAEVLDSLAPALARLGVEFPSLESFLERLRALPMFAGRWNDYLTRHFTYDVERTASGGVRSKVVRHAIEEEVANLQRARLWVWHHQVQAPTLLLRAPDGLLVAGLDGEVLGVAAYRADWVQCRFGTLVAVREDRRKHGVARALFRAVEGMSPSPRIFSSTEETNAVSIQMHTALGFQTSGHIDNLPQGYRELLFYKRLRP